MTHRATQYERLAEPQKRGQATEAILKAEFLVRDISVLVPAYDNDPYDFVIDLDGEFYRVQAKTAYANKPGTVQFETVSTKTRSDGYDRDNYTGKADLFAVYNPILDEAYLIRVADAARGKMEIRYEPTKNGQTVGVNWHEEFLFDTVLSSL